MATRARAGVGDLEFESPQSQPRLKIKTPGLHLKFESPQSHQGLKIKTPGLKLASLLVRVGSIRHQHLPEREADDSRRVVAGGHRSAAAVEEDERHVPAQPHLVLDVGQALGFAWHLPRRADELSRAS